LTYTTGLLLLVFLLPGEVSDWDFKSSCNKTQEVVNIYPSLFISVS
jgi:hypothetical protein